MRDQQKDKSIEEIAAFIQELVHEVEKGLLYSFYLSLEAKTEDELKAYHKEIKNISDALELSLTKYIFAQKKAYDTMLPFIPIHSNKTEYCSLQPSLILCLLSLNKYMIQMEYS